MLHFFRKYDRIYKERFMGYTFITGATGGLGQAFCLAAAKRRENLFLTGRSGEKLERLKSALVKKYPEIKIDFYPCRLDSEESRASLFRYITDGGFTFSRLINAAGADVQKAFLSYDMDKVIFQIRSDFEAAVCVTRFVLERAEKNLKIIAVSSVSGIYPMPYFAIYSAAKGATTSFFISLREELKEKGFFVTAVLPGAMPTRDDIKEQIKGQGLWGRLAAKSPDFVAEKSLKKSDKNKRKYIPGFFNNVMNVGTRLIPLPLKLKFIARRWSKISKDAF